MSLATPVRSLLVLSAAAALFVLPARTARAQCDAPTNCMPPPTCPYKSSSVVTYPNGAQVQIHSMHNPTACMAPPPPGGITNSFFDIYYDITYTGPNGSGGYDALTDGLLILRHLSTDPLGDHYQGEWSGMHVAGGTLPPGTMLRESPTRQSLGLTDIAPDPGGFRIDSFFDVFTELSIDGGQTWIPSDQPSHQTATSQPTLAHPSTWGALKFIYR
jgi:hypothetical protein